MRRAGNYRVRPGGDAPDSKKIENHAHAVSLHYMHYSFARPHKTLTKEYGKRTTPAMAAGLAQYPWSVFQIAELLD